jgi:hypothetical protein
MLSAHQVLDSAFPLNGGNLIVTTGYYTGSGTAPFVGTGTLTPRFPGDNFNVSSDNTSISVVVKPNNSGNVPSFSGTDTITYLFGTSAPEPASFVMLSIGLAAVGVVAWRRRAVR